MTSLQKLILLILSIIAIFVIVLFSTMLYMMINEQEPAAKVQIVSTATVTKIPLPTRVDIPTATSTKLPTRVVPPTATSTKLPTRVIPPTTTSTEFPTKARPMEMPQNQGVEFAYYLTLFGSDSIILSDALGHSTRPIPGTDFQERVPNVSVYRTGQYAQMMVLPVGPPFTITFKTISLTLDITTPVAITVPVAITLQKGNGDDIVVQMVRYRDLALPAGVTVRLTLPFQDTSLRYDKDNNNDFESVISPTINFADTKGVDIIPPTVMITADTTNFITITAKDNESGIKMVFYSFDKHTFLPYTSSFQIDPLKISTIYAFADDNLGNRSGLETYLTTK